MNYLQLCVRLREEADISGGGPTSVLNQSGQLKNITNWIQQSWIDIQQKRPNWEFMRSEFTFDTVIGQRDYEAAVLATPITDLKLWDLESFLVYDKALGELDQKKIINISYSYWRDVYRAQMNARPTNRIQYMTRLPDNKIRFEPSPDAIYTIDGEYKRSTQTFTDDLDVPTNLPEDFHALIVWGALKYYALFENAPEVLEQAEMFYDGLMNRLELEQLPVMREDREPLA